MSIQKACYKVAKPACIILVLVSITSFFGFISPKHIYKKRRPATGRVEFSREFAPSEGFIKGPEKEIRKEVCLNGNWDFQPVYGPYNEKQTTPYGIDAEETAPDLPNPVESGWEATKMKIPCSWNSGEEYPSYPEKWGQAQMGWLRKIFTVPANWDGKRIIIRFQAVSGDSKVFLNGEQIGANFDSTLPFSFDITDKVKKGSLNEIRIGIRSHTFFNKQGTYGKITYPPGAPGIGIWQDVYLIALPKVFISDVFIKPFVSENLLSAEVTIRNTTNQSKTVNLSADVREWINLAGKGMLEAPEVKWKSGEKALELAPVKAVIPANGESVIVLHTKVNGRLKYWDFNSPNLYGITVSLAKNKQPIDKKYERFGWREFKISGKQLLLNGKSVQLLGDAQHLQNATFLTRRYAWSWFKLLKDVGGNAARLHAMIYPEIFHDMADEMGIALLPESSIYASSCDINYDSKLFWKAAKYNVRGLVEKYRNHPSVYGWSIENEVLPALNVKCNDPVYKKMVYDGMGELADICKKSDPTRNWISGDGSRDMDGRLPVFNQHYGSTEGYLRESAATDKPYCVGEASIAYYAMPRQAEMYVGDRAYRSYKDYQDGIAVDVYELLKVERKVATYCSVWNVGYYGVEVLPLGMTDVSKAPTSNDGVFLTAPYVEGKPGIQPERIPPYAAHYNPGYDPNYPLYKPLPLYYAVKAAYKPVPEPCEWDHRSTYTNPPAPEINNLAIEVLFYGKEGSDLFFKLKSIGIPLVYQSSAPKVIIIDCNSVDMNAGLASKIKTAVKDGATAVFWGLTPGNQSQIAQALPYPAEAFDRQAMSMVCNEADNRVASIPYKDLYFTENTDSKTIMNYGLKGAFVSNGNVLLKASAVDWTKGNTKGMLRSERESTEGPSLVEVKDGAGSYMVSTLELQVISPEHIRMLSQLFRNIGVAIKPVAAKRGSLFDQASILTRSLISGTYGADSVDEAFNKDFIGGETSVKPKYEMESNGKAWNVIQGTNGVLRFNNLKSKDTSVKSNVVYLSFWVECPQPLNEIMTDPNVPEVGFNFSTGGASKIWLNGQEKFSSVKPADNASIDKLPLIKGWNHFMVKVVETGNSWNFTGRLVSKNFELLSSMQSALDPYSDHANFFTISHTDPEIHYDRSWGLYGDGWYQSAQPGAKAVFKFYGTGFTLTGKVGPDGGKAKLYIDGNLEQVINYKQDMPDPHHQLYSKSGFNDGEHDVTIEVIDGQVTVGPYQQWESYK